MTTLALIAAACIWFAAGYLAAELVRVVRRIATVFRERTGEIAWIDNEKPIERM